MRHSESERLWKRQEEKESDGDEPGASPSACAARSAHGCPGLFQFVRVTSAPVTAPLPR